MHTLLLRCDNQGDSEVPLRRYPIGVWLGIIFSLVLAAGALYWDESRLPLSPGASWGTAASVNAEYRAAAKRLTLPDGYEWPSETPFPAKDGNGVVMTYGAGFGTQWAEQYWFNAWASVAVSSTVSTATREAALRRLPEFYESSIYANTQEPEYYRQIITEAQQGDLTALRLSLGLDEPLDDGGVEDE
jgi:hypothetical protein